MKEYHKIEGLFERNPETKKLEEGKFRNPIIEYLKNNKWEFTEKIDGTNIRVIWDGHKVSFYGRTDKSQIPAELTNRLIELFGGNNNEELFEQKFGGKPAMLIGEGYGGKIQGKNGYSKKEDFILFDVIVGDSFLNRESVNDIAEYFQIKSVPVIFTGTIKEGIEYVKTEPDSAIGNEKSEGLVGRPIFELNNNIGRRIITKIKVRDFI